MEKGRSLSLAEAVVDTPAWMDMGLMLGALVKAVLAMCIAVLKPLLTMVILVTRMFEISCRPTGPGCPAGLACFQPMGPRCVWLQTYFSAYFLPTFGLLAYWSWHISAPSLAVVVLLQFSGLYLYYAGTPGHCLRQGAVPLGGGPLARPAPRLRGPLGLLGRNPAHAAELAAWRATSAGDLLRLPDASLADFPLCWLGSQVLTSWYGVLGISLMRAHPDLAAASGGARCFLRRNCCALGGGVLAAYGLLTQLHKIAGSA
ncbi:hypothetical protein ABPG75_011992 [Micractinium tetrahymenae]